MKKLISFILIISLLAAASILTFADEDAETISEEGEGVFELAQVQADEAEENGAEYEGFIVKIDPSEEIDAAQIEGLELIDEEEGLYTADSIETLESEVPGEIIDYIEPDYLMELFDSADPNDPYFSSDQWNLSEMKVQQLWKAGIEGQDFDNIIDMDHDGKGNNDQIVVAILDSGLNMSHEDIDGGRIIGAHNIITASSDVSDEVGHGTFVTGIIMASKNNSKGIAGIGQNIRVMPIKVFEGRTTQTSSVVNALNYIISQKKIFDNTAGSNGINVSVINISFGGNMPSELLKAAVESAIDAGIIVICAAGNNGNSDPIYPAMYAIGVGSYNSTGTVSAFSQRLSSENGSGYANKVWISAPGEGILSTYTGNASYERKSGTSYSCPAITALAAICKGIDNSLSHYGFKQILKDTSVYRNSGLGTVAGQDAGYGWGTADFVAAVEAVKKDKLFHEDGWYKSGNGNWYYYSSNFAVKGWQKINGVNYCFNNSGIMQTGWQQINGKWYYFNGSGAMQTGWLKYGGKWYYLNGSGDMATGWVKDGGKWYYLNGSGVMATGWVKDGSTWYFLNDSGAMQTGWLKRGSTWYYLRHSGAMAVGWEKVNGSWYYFSSSGAMATGWVKDGGKWYYLRSSGAMVSGWQKINGKEYFFKSSGAMAENEWVSGYWWLSSSGAWTYPYKGSWHKDSNGWWFGDTSGWYAKNTTETINGVAYTFDARGYWME